MSLLLELNQNLQTDVDEPIETTWLPAVEDVATPLHGRTRDSAGRLLGTFTDQTDPTAAQVEEAIDDAVDELQGVVPFPLPDAPGRDPDALRRKYRRVVTLLTAANIELGYPTSRGTLDHYDRLYKRYQDALASLIEAVAETGQGGGGLSVESAQPVARHTFTGETLVGPETVY